jgi:ribA/ribD-fused uncharacterized protein
MSNLDVKKYYRNESIVFRKTKENFGGLSNMAAGYPIILNGIKILSSEALYQACRYPHLPEVQKTIIDQKSPMTAKMKSKKFRHETRHNWERDRIKIMRWCLRIKLSNNWLKFSELLLSTGNSPIVEESYKDDFWGAKPVDVNLLIGTNALGRLLMELRSELQQYELNKKYLLNPPNLNDFFLYGKTIETTYLYTDYINLQNQNMENSLHQISMHEYLFECR